MTIATNNGVPIIRDGKVVTSCNCCGGWFCYSPTAGACCNGTQCRVVQQCDCDTENGEVWFGIGTTCNMPGACCDGINCRIVPNPCECIASSGENFKGIGSVCEPTNPCLVPCACCEHGPPPISVNARVTVVFRNVLTGTEWNGSTHVPVYSDFNVLQDVPILLSGVTTGCRFNATGLANSWTYGFPDEATPEGPPVGGFQITQSFVSASTWTSSQPNSCVWQVNMEMRIRIKRTGGIIFPAVADTGRAQFPGDLTPDSSWPSPIVYTKNVFTEQCAPPTGSFQGVTVKSAPDAQGDVFGSLTIDSFNFANPLP